MAIAGAISADSRPLGVRRVLGLCALVLDDLGTGRRRLPWLNLAAAGICRRLIADAAIAQSTP